MLGVCYYPEHWPESWWERDAAEMAALGIRYVRIGEFAWSRVEPEPGRFTFEWLDRAIETLGKAGLKVVLGTPTATPPKWLVDLYPEILPHGEDGRPRGFGSRRHYTFSSAVWLRESARIVTAFAERYGQNPHVAGWQTDNEYGCHDTILSYGPEDLAAFRSWLRRRYQTPDALNEAWGNVFWSMELSSFDDAVLPVAAVTETGPAARLDFWRFSSEQVVRYNEMQTAILRRLSPGRFVTHNYMGFFHDFDHYAVSEVLDFASWDSYPLGFLEKFPFSEEERARFTRTSHPDVPAFHHDLYRGMAGNRFWVMEQQPGPVNWAPWNAVPMPGMVRLWAWEAFAHGAEVVSYFRWRQAPFAQEQMHAGLNRPDRVRSVGGEEAAQVGVELAAFGPLPENRPSPVALVFDYEASWITRIQPQGADYRHEEISYRWYEAVRRLGLDVDIVPPGADLSAYSLVLLPSLPHVSPAMLQALKATEATVLIGPRAGSKTRDFAFPDNLPPGPLAELLPITVTQVASMRPGRHAVAGDVAGGAGRWREWLETELAPVASFDDGGAAVVAHDRFIYVATWPEADLLGAIVETLALPRAGLTALPIPPDTIRIRRRGDLTFAFNYGTEPWTVPEAESKRFRLGGATIAPQDLACWEG
ncbi:beta-galactosidase [Kaistia geumhonensis]|uniref:Beta-galactosidase n=1 Tax=Kaistia geumhonensis TaxID=410839 RepID=A0ABU0M511_9HYPH|nr:beta-galactosidase [Kaistia geumhonensis]MCX5478728.1 beta-galactosidase [Kaistia geumhonensis]MDQ0516054.1 beta-galactosidase [Kaistia geumhonensis]